MVRSAGGVDLRGDQLDVGPVLDDDVAADVEAAVAGDLGCLGSVETAVPLALWESEARTQRVAESARSRETTPPYRQGRQGLLKPVLLASGVEQVP